MKLLRFDLRVPFWCSFGEFGTLNIQQTYHLPPPPTLFGFIQNALGKSSVHTITDENARRNYINEMLKNYSKLSFAIIVKFQGEKIDDYLNIFKGNREIEKEEANLLGRIEEKIKSFKFYSQLTKDKKKTEDKEVRKISNKLKRHDLEQNSMIEALDLLQEKGVSNSEVNELSEEIKCFWKSLSRLRVYEVNRKWLRTQIRRQRLISPEYTIFIKTEDSGGQYSLENISSHLRNPKRPLYLGESDDLVNVIINDEGIIETEDDNHYSSEISSVIPGIYEDCQITEIPIKIRNDIPKKEDKKGHRIVCSIPVKKLKQEIPCIKVQGENIVFL